jgi:hypothetical protein
MGELPKPVAGHPKDCSSTDGAVLLGMLALTDAQLEIVMTAAGSLPVEKRSAFLERVAARLRLRGSHLTDAFSTPRYSPH